MKISVALCTYNGEKYIEEQILSILNQTVPVAEIVVRDDGSTDSTIPIIQKIACDHPGIHWDIKVNESNQGVVKNFENAIFACQGDYIFLSDQDDIWMRNKVQTIMDFFSSHPQTKVVFSNAEMIDEHGNILGGKTLFDYVGLNNDLWDKGLGAELMISENRITGATMAMRGKPLPFAQFDVNMLHDERIALEALSHNSLSIIHKPLIAYRNHSEQTCGITPLPSDFDSLRLEVAQRILKLPVSAELLNRIKFREWRIRQTKSRAGWMRIFFAMPKYFRYFKSYAMPVIRKDFVASWRCMVNH